MKWLIIEDALRDRKGHWLEYVSTFVRGLKELGDEVTVLCDRKAEGFVMEHTGARPVLPESIWHRMGDGAGALKRYARVPGHAVATFFAMRKVFRGFDRQNTRKGTKGDERGAGSRERGERSFEPPITQIVTDKGREAGPCLDKPSGAAFSNPFTSELARDAENSSLTRSASGHASSPGTSYSLPVTAPEAQALDTRLSTLDSSPASPDWIFVPTVLVHHLLGWWMLLKTGSVPRESRVLLFFPNLPIRLDHMGLAHWSGGPTTKLMAWLFGQLRNEVESGRVVLGVETHAMRRALEGLIQMPVVYLTHPVEASTSGLQGGTTNHTNIHERGRQGDAQGTCAGASEPDSLASELADAPVSESPTRSASAIPCFDPRPSSLDSRPKSPANSNSPPGTSAKPIVFGCYGAARWEKGSDIFLKAIRLVLQKAEKLKSLDPRPSALDSSLAATAAGRPLRFAIQWVEDFRDDSGNLVSIDPWLKNHPQVEVIDRYFQGDEYERHLERTDVMVLPYRSPYRLRVSRVVIEAMMSGMPVIATKGTTLFEQAKEYGTVVACDGADAKSLAEAIWNLVTDFERMQHEAHGKSEIARTNFSVKYFRELLIKFSSPSLHFFKNN